MAASKVNVGNRTKEQDAEAADALIAERAAEGAEIVEEDGGFYAVTQSFGFTVKTRIG